MRQAANSPDLQQMDKLINVRIFYLIELSGSVGKIKGATKQQYASSFGKFPNASLCWLF
jgi:hypothetical protein